MSTTQDEGISSIEYEQLKAQSPCGLHYSYLPADKCPECLLAAMTAERDALKVEILMLKELDDYNTEIIIVGGRKIAEIEKKIAAYQAAPTRYEEYTRGCKETAIRCAEIAEHTIIKEAHQGTALALNMKCKAIADAIRKEFNL